MGTDEAYARLKSKESLEALDPIDGSKFSD
jgi:hypothetical protein